MLNIIIKPLCLHCKENPQESFSLCEKCFHNLQEADKKSRCGICGFPIEGKGTICERCFIAKDCFDKAYFLFPFKDEGKTLIHNIKFKDKLHLLSIIERLKGKRLDILLNDIDCITYIPSPYLTFAGRGYNVSFEIGKKISELYGIEVVKLFKTNALYKKRLAVTSNKKERKQIVDKFLKLKKTNRSFNKILIVDDVFTTGVTLNGATKLLKESGIAKMCNVFTLARVL
jgi:predicted amidophosphoribosyltransferase